MEVLTVTELLQGADRASFAALSLWPELKREASFCQGIAVTNLEVWNGEKEMFLEDRSALLTEQLTLKHLSRYLDHLLWNRDIGALDSKSTFAVLRSCVIFSQSLKPMLDLMKIYSKG